MEKEFSQLEEREAMNIEQFLWDNAWLPKQFEGDDTIFKPQGWLDDTLNNWEVRYNEQDGAFYEA